MKKSLDASIAYTIGTEFQRCGLAYEGLTAVLELLFDKIAVISVKAWIDTRNEPSIGLVKKLGMNQTEFIAKADHFKGADSDEFVFAIARSEWLHKAKPLETCQ